MRDIDWNGHVPDGGLLDAGRLALQRIEQSQELVYQLAEQLGVTRAELDARAQINAA